MVEVFKTNVTQPDQAYQLVVQLKQLLPRCKINFDLEDCDNVLRVESTAVSVNMVMSFIHEQGFVCEVLQ